MKKESVNLAKGKLEFLTEPYSAEELKTAINEECEITDIVRVDLHDIFDTDFEGFLDIISEELVGNELLNEPSYHLIGSDNESNLYFEVTGTVEILEDEPEEEEQQSAYAQVYCDCDICPSRIGGICTAGAISIDDEGRCIDGSSY